MKKTRHGLYISIELLDRLRILAEERNNSVNRQIEDILIDWLDSHSDDSEISRKAFLKLPKERRGAILQEQAEKLAEYYEGLDLGPVTDFHDYD